MTYNYIAWKDYEQTSETFDHVSRHPTRRFERTLVNTAAALHKPATYVSLLPTAAHLLINHIWWDIALLLETEIIKVVNCYKLGDNFWNPTRLETFLCHKVKSGALVKTALLCCKDKGIEARILLSPHFYRLVTTSTELNSMDRLRLYLDRVVALSLQRNSLYSHPIVEVFCSNSCYML